MTAEIMSPVEFVELVSNIQEVVKEVATPITTISCFTSGFLAVLETADDGNWA
jgi:hypothetical protein